jgi:hypothetical protein
MHRHMVERRWIFDIQEKNSCFGNWKHGSVAASSDKDTGQRRALHICIRCKMCIHAMPNPPIGSASTAAVPHRHKGTQMHRETGRRRSGSGVWTLRRSTFLPPTFSIRLYYLASAAQQEHPTEQIPRQDQINPPSFVNNHLDVRTKRNKTCPPACILIVILGFVCRMILCVCVFYHVPKQILLALFVNDS